MLSQTVEYALRAPVFVASRLSPFLLCAAIVACPGERPAEGGVAPSGGAGQLSRGAAVKVAPTGRIIEVAMTTDDKGSYFIPANLQANPGDVVRFTLETGVHNVHFLPDSNPGKQGLPPASEFLQLPGQTWDFLVSLSPGDYYFQCDPHALLGMVGRLKVEGK